MIATAVANVGLAEGPNLDIVGIKIGVSEPEAVAALKAHNPRLVVNETPHRLEGLPKAVMPAVTAQAMPSGDQEGETVNMVFTMAPGPEKLWGIQRITSYPAARRPSTAATLDALRKKYGPENVPNNQSGLQTVNIAWVFGPDGKLLEPDKAKQAYYSGQGPLQGHFGQDDMSALNDLQMGISQDKATSYSITLITASVQSTQGGDFNAPFVIYNMIVAINDGRIYVPALEATRAVLLDAAKARTKPDDNKAAGI
jgi:hypothetical protein